MPDQDHAELHVELLETRAACAVSHAWQLYYRTQYALQDVLQDGPDAIGKGALVALWTVLVTCLKKEFGATRQYLIDVGAYRDDARAQLNRQPDNRHCRAAYDKLMKHVEVLTQRHNDVTSLYNRLLDVLQAPRIAPDT